MSRRLSRAAWLMPLFGLSLVVFILSAALPSARTTASAQAAPAAAFAMLNTAVVAFAGEDAHAHAAFDQVDADAGIAGTLGFGAPTGAVSVATVAVDIANLRGGPGLGYVRRARLPMGTVVTVIERGTDWVRVRTPGGTTGWVFQELLIAGDHVAKGGILPKSTPAKPLAQATLRNSRVNLRSGPSTRYTVLDKLAKGARVNVIGQDQAWYQVQTDAGKTGWVNSNYLAVGSGAPAAAPAVAVGGGAPAPAAAVAVEPAGTINVSRANLRQGPGITFAAITTLGRRTALTLVARHGDWYKVSTARGVSGWVSGELVGASAEVLSRVPVTNDVPAAPRVAEPPATSNRWVWPTQGRFTSRFGWRWGTFHNGIDIANRRWTPIAAARAGTVIQAGWCRGYGYCVMINHGNGYVTEYGHMASHPPVYAGQQVGAGKLIGYMGSTYDRRGGGYATGVHLHFTVKRYGVAANPLKFLP